MRVFYAAFLGAETATFYDGLVGELSELLPGVVRAVPSGSHHLTMVFVGDVVEDELVHCMEALSALPTAARIPITLEPARVLYGRGSPRLILADVAKGAEALVSIQSELRGSHQERFPDKELRPRRTHATLARFSKGLHMDSGKRVEKTLRKLSNDSRRDFITSIRLVKSSLTPSGPVYETLDERRLESRDEK